MPNDRGFAGGPAAGGRASQNPPVSPLRTGRFARIVGPDRVEWQTHDRTLRQSGVSSGQEFKTVKRGRPSADSRDSTDSTGSWTEYLNHRPLLVAIAGPNGAGKSTS